MIEVSLALTVPATGVQWVAKGTGTTVISSGVVQVFLAWIIAPGLSGIFGAIIFTITKYGVMLRQNPAWKAFFYVPVYFGLTAALLTMLLLWKGGGYEVRLTDPEIVGTIIGVGAAWALLMGLTLMPWLYRVVLCDDWQLRWWHIPMGPLLLRRPPPPPQPDHVATVKDYYAGRLTKEELAARKAAEGGDVEGVPEQKAANAENSDAASGEQSGAAPAQQGPKKLVGPKPEGPWHSGPVLFWYVKWALLRGIDQDVVKAQDNSSALSRNLDEVHAHAAHYDNKAEYMYSFLQVMTAATASFTHGANDIANAIGPYATVFQVWDEGKIPGSKANVPVWILVFGGACLVIGVWTYGYNIMRNLGNRLTLQSPSRGFSMELGSAITVIMATRLSKSCCRLRL